MSALKVTDTIESPEAKVIPITGEKKISVFGAAKVKPATKAAAKDDKPTVDIPGLESQLIELQDLKAKIADLTAREATLVDIIKNIGKEKFVELYKANGQNPNTFLIKDGAGCVMVLPTDKYISIKDEARAEYLKKEYGDDVVTTEEKYFFTPSVLERNQAAIEALIMDATTISEADKENLLTKEVKYSITKGMIDNLAPYKNRLENVLDDVQPIFMLKNCGGKMELGGFFETGGDLIMEAPVKTGYSLCCYAPVYESGACTKCGNEHPIVLSEEELTNEVAEHGGYEEGSEELEQIWEARKYSRGGGVDKEYEISYGKSVYWGKYHVDDNKIVMDDCYTMNDEEQVVEVADEKLLQLLYGKLEDDKVDEIAVPYDYDEYKKGGELLKNKWIQSALSSGHPGALRKTAMRKGLLKGKDDKLSKTDLKKLKAMGGKTAKRARLAETLSKFEKGGGIGKRYFGVRGEAGIPERFWSVWEIDIKKAMQDEKYKGLSEIEFVNAMDKEAEKGGFYIKKVPSNEVEKQNILKLNGFANGGYGAKA